MGVSLKMLNGTKSLPAEDLAEFDRDVLGADDVVSAVCLRHAATLVPDHVKSRRRSEHRAGDIRRWGFGIEAQVG